MCTYVRAFARKCVYVRAHIHARVGTRVCACTRDAANEATHVSVCACACVGTHVYAGSRTCGCACVCACVYVYMHV